jgi:hypothetical protein
VKPFHAPLVGLFGDVHIKKAPHPFQPRAARAHLKQTFHGSRFPMACPRKPIQAKFSFRFRKQARLIAKNH